MKIVGRAVGASPQANRRLAEIGGNPLGELAAYVGRNVGASDAVNTKLKEVGGYAEYLGPHWGQVRVYGKLAGKAIAGEQPTTDDVQNAAEDMRAVVAGTTRRINHSQPETDNTGASSPKAVNEKTTSVAERLERIQTEGLGGKGALDAAKQWAQQDAQQTPGGARSLDGSAHTGAASSNPGARASAFRKYRGGVELASKASTHEKFDQAAFGNLKKVNADGCCQGLSLEAIQRIDRAPASTPDLSSAVSEIAKSLKKSNPAQAELVASIESKQHNLGLAAFRHYQPAPTVRYHGDRQMSINGLENSIRAMAENDVALLRVNIRGKDGVVLNHGHMLAVQRLRDQQYQLFDPNNGVFSYQTEDSLRNAFESYMDAAYADKGVLVPDSFTKYRYRVAQSGAGSSHMPPAPPAFGKDHDFPYIDANAAAELQAEAGPPAPVGRRR